MITPMSDAVEENPVSAPMPSFREQSAVQTALPQQVTENPARQELGVDSPTRYQAELRQRDQRITQQEDELKQLRDTLQKFQYTESRIVGQRNKAENELREAKIRYAEAEKRLSEREAEMATLKTYLSGHNESSDEDIGRLTESINDHIERLAERGAMEWANEATTPVDVDIKHTASRDHIQKIIGVDLFEALQKATPGYSSTLLLQFAWEASLVATVHRALCLFSAPLIALGGKGEDNSNIEKVMGRVLQEIGKRGPLAARPFELIDVHNISEPFTVQSQWRSMTHQYLRLVVSQAEQEAHWKEIIRYASVRCRFVSALAFHNASLDWKKYEGAFTSGMQEIVGLVQRLIIMIREQVATKGFWTVVPVYQRAFDKSAMEICEAMDGEEDYVKEGSYVACTTRLGLSYTSEGGRDGPALMHLFKKPHVVTQYAIADLLNAEVAPGEPIEKH